MAAQVALRRQQDQEEYMRAVQLTQPPIHHQSPSGGPSIKMPPADEISPTTMAASPPTSMIHEAALSWNPQAPLTPPVQGEFMAVLSL